MTRRAGNASFVTSIVLALALALALASFGCTRLVDLTHRDGGTTDGDGGTSGDAGIADDGSLSDDGGPADLGDALPSDGSLHG